MANIDPAPSWANIRRLETTDRNMAGPGGILNDPTTSIAARLNLLRDNDTTLGSSISTVIARQDAADSTIATIQGQVLNAPGTLSDLDHGAPISVTGDQFPDVLSIDNSRGPVLALNESIADLVQRDEYLKIQSDENKISSGNIQSKSSPRGSASNGGVLTIDSDGKIIGFSIPSGQRGGGTYFSGDFPSVNLRGRRVKVVQKFNATSGFIGNPLGINPAIQVQSKSGSTVSTVTPISFVNSQQGNVVTQVGVFDVPSNSDFVGLVILLFNGSPTTSNQSITIQSISYSITSADIGESLNDTAIALRLNPMLDAIRINEIGVAANTLTSGAMLSDAVPRAQVFNGAVINYFGDGRVSGFSVPSGQQGGSSYVSGDVPVEYVRGRKITITQNFTATLGFIGTFSVNPALAAQYKKGSTISPLSVISKTTSQSGTVVTQTAVLIVPSDADWVGVGLQIYGGSTAPSNMSINLSGIRYSLVDADPGETLADSTLDFRVNSILQKAIPSGDSDGYQATVIVKPSGGDFTHPKLAIDSITDASAAKKYRVAIYPGVYSGYAEWHLKDWVDLVGVGLRDEIIIGYENPNDASAATIRNTSVFWAARRANIKNITVQIKNGRYAIHAESDGQRPDNEFGIYNCVVRHLGNASATNNDWAVGSQYAVGSGNSPGELYILRGSHFEGPGGGFSYHTPGYGMPVGATYSEATMVDVEGCSFKATVNGNASFAIKPIRPGAGDWCRLVGSTFDGMVLYATNEWISPDTTTNRAQIYVFGYGNTGMNFITNVTGPVNTYIPSFT